MQNPPAKSVHSLLAKPAVAMCLLLVLGSGCSTLVAPSTATDQPPSSRLGGWLKYITEPLQKYPSHDRLWRPDLAILPYAEIEHDRILLKNIRDCDYRTEDDYDVRQFDRQILLTDVRTIDFIVVPFVNAPLIAHTMLSFGLANGEQVVFSVEARLETHESYALGASTNNQYELIWVVGTERDLILLRTEVRKVDVYLYPIKASPEQVQKAFLAAVARVNQIAREPEFYDLVTNNCTTNIVDLVNQIRPGTVQGDLRILLPGHSDRLAYELGLLAAQGPFEEIKAASKINLAAQLHADDPHFSQAIRRQR